MVTKIELTDRYLRIDGLRVHVIEGGEGTPLLLVHGLGGPRAWQRVLEALSHHFRVLSVDLPGFGESDPPQRSYASGDYAEFLFNLTCVLEARKIILCGISWGGEIAVRFADRHPDRVDRLVLLCSTGLHHREYAGNRLVARIVQGLLETAVLRSGWLIDRASRRSYYSIESRPAGLCNRFSEDLGKAGRRRAFSAAFLDAFQGDPDFSARLSRLTIPALVVWGRNDAIVPMKDALELHRHMPDSRLELIPQCGHSIPLEKPRELVEAILTFNGKEVPSMNR